MVGVVYVVDDDAPYRTAIRRHLKAVGYDVYAYSSAEQFLAQPLDESVPSCILLDLQMPGLTGPELQERLKKRGSLIPIVYLTASPELIDKRFRAGVVDILTKPVKSERLLQSIENALSRHKCIVGRSG